MSEEQLPGRSVLTSYVSTESMLSKVLQVVPYCEEHEHVWSPALATILQETCSQLDSLWKYEARQSPCVKEGRFSIRDYFGYFGERIASKWVVFWGELPMQIRPFEEWAGLPDYSPDRYVELDWWSAYNKVKHDRFRNLRLATLKSTARALSALFLAILRSEACRDEVAEMGWLSSIHEVSYNPQASLGEDSPSVKDNYVAAESELFSYPVGWCMEKISPRDKWIGYASLKFKRWFDAYPNA